MISFCNGELKAFKAKNGWGLVQTHGAGLKVTLCPSLGGVFWAVGAAKGLSDD
jgi:hypothetical protein